MEYTVFVICRLLGVVLRPLTLMFALKLPDGVFASDYALLLTAITSTYVIYGNQNHRYVYTYFVGATARRKGLGGAGAILRYLDGVFVHVLVFSPLVALVVWIWVGNMWMFALIMPLILIEKFYDDQQRIMIYHKHYNRWCLHFVFRTIIPSGAILTGVIFFDWGSIGFYAILCVIMWFAYATFVASQFTQVLMSWVLRLGRNGMLGLSQCTYRYLSDYMNEYFGAQVFSILAVNLLVVDRFFVRLNFEDHFATYVFAVNVFMIVPVIHNLFYFIKIRPQLIDLNRSVVGTVLGLRNLLPPVIVALGAFSSFPVMDALGIVDLPLPYDVLAGLAVVYIIAAASFVLHEFVFWRVRRTWLLLLDFTLFSLYFAILGFGSPTLNAIVFTLAAVLLTRALSMAVLSNLNTSAIRISQIESTSTL